MGQVVTVTSSCYASLVGLATLRATLVEAQWPAVNLWARVDLQTCGELAAAEVVTIRVFRLLRDVEGDARRGKRCTLVRPLDGVQCMVEQHHSTCRQSERDEKTQEKRRKRKRKNQKWRRETEALRVEVRPIDETSPLHLSTALTPRVDHLLVLGKGIWSKLRANRLAAVSSQS